MTVASQAEGSWGLHGCCAKPGNDCRRNTCTDHTSLHDFLFRLEPGGAKRFNPTGSDNVYQQVGADMWPVFGQGADLYTGGSHAPGGIYGHCHQMTYAAGNAVICGGYSNWGQTDIEVWHPTPRD